MVELVKERKTSCWHFETSLTTLFTTSTTTWGLEQFHLEIQIRFPWVFYNPI